MTDVRPVPTGAFMPLPIPALDEENGLRFIPPDVLMLESRNGLLAPLGRDEAEKERLAFPPIRYGMNPLKLPEYGSDGEALPVIIGVEPP